MMLWCACSTHAQEPVTGPGGFSPIDSLSSRHTVSTWMLGGIVTASLVDSYFAWWSNAERPFSFYTEDWLNGPHLGIDKPGHFFGTYFIFHLVRDVMLWGGYGNATANWWAIGLSSFHGLSVEIGDGFSPYGFDYQDLLFNFGGVAYAFLQTEFPYLQNFNFKFSYWSSKGLKSPANFTEDYDALTIWLSMNMHEILPEPVGKFWPEFLQVAVGYGVGEHETKREFVIGLDFNLEAFQFHNDDVLLAQKILNTMHFPAPAVKFTPRREPTYYLFHLR